MRRRSEGMGRRMDTGEVKKSSEGQAAVLKPGAGLGASKALTAMEQEDKEVEEDALLIKQCPGILSRCNNTSWF